MWHVPVFVDAVMLLRTVGTLSVALMGCVHCVPQFCFLCASVSVPASAFQLASTPLHCDLMSVSCSGAHSLFVYPRPCHHAGDYGQTPHCGAGRWREARCAKCAVLLSTADSLFLAIEQVVPPSPFLVTIHHVHLVALSHGHHSTGSESELISDRSLAVLGDIACAVRAGKRITDSMGGGAGGGVPLYVGLPRCLEGRGQCDERASLYSCDHIACGVDDNLLPVGPIPHSFFCALGTRTRS